ncbi:hypothetical protein BHE90_004025 [Fusarium euwallaceae]|uniref:Large ribosomal subunit protein mL49 n=3 Tax=Fusarium solani species complex TaxID=232080 RepID=A0A3M2S122_9HYPO|nr:hypothetical protein CDV36_009113 [Fusarium kuroshium]RSL77043.1 hypothetical protein CEP51_009415 [Fusarium floridanum]RTE81499.1 hypothetical protein BHE90_004025 [Fusarium euwallaceae]
MRLFAPRTLSTGCQALLQRPISLVQRCTYASATQPTFKTHAGYRTNPLDKPVNPTRKNKIPYKDRPIQRSFAPLPTKTEKQLAAAFPYIVRRTPYSQLPVYQKWMSGGNRVLVLIKKVDGDRTRLMEDLTTALEVKRSNIRLNPTTQHIEIKGPYFKQAMDWLLNAGF